MNNDILRTKYNYFHFNAGIACQQFLLNLINSLPLSTDDIDDKFIDYFFNNILETIDQNWLHLFQTIKFMSNDKISFIIL